MLEAYPLLNLQGLLGAEGLEVAQGHRGFLMEELALTYQSLATGIILDERILNPLLPLWVSPVV